MRYCISIQYFHTRSWVTASLPPSATFGHRRLRKRLTQRTVFSAASKATTSPPAWPPFHGLPLTQRPTMRWRLTPAPPARSDSSSKRSAFATTGILTFSGPPTGLSRSGLTTRLDVAVTLPYLAATGEPHVRQLPPRPCRKKSEQLRADILNFFAQREKGGRLYQAAFR